MSDAPQDIRLELVGGEVITLRPDDTVVLTVPSPLSQHDADWIREAWHRQAPDIRMLLLSGGVQVSAVMRLEDILTAT